jgi:pimeloyl-ACP methyl ester carboxylesterase
MQPETRYAKSGSVNIAYQTFGEGSDNLVIVPGFVSNIEHFWDEPGMARGMLDIARSMRVVIFDKRGTGLSDRVAELPGLDQRKDDLRVVMDAAGMDHAAVLGVSEGGPLSVLFAATHPDRCRGLILYGAFVRSRQSTVDSLLEYIDRHWGTGASVAQFAPSRADDPAFQRWWARCERLGASPAAAAAIIRMNGQIDVSEVLPTIRVPTLVLHQTGDKVCSVKGARAFAERIPSARLIEFAGDDHLFFAAQNAPAIIGAIVDFVTGSTAPVPADRVLATVLFTDIVASTERAAALGDTRWREALERHNAIVRRQIARFRGRERKMTGDGFLVTFDGPARAVSCAGAIVDEMRAVGMEIRAGLHTGECEEIGDDVGGMAVHIGARVAALAAASQVLVSRTVKDLVAGSGLRFAPYGEHSLKGVQGKWDVYAVER